MPENSITVSANASVGELHISAPNTRQTLDVTNNKAKYYAEQAKQYRDEAKYYAEENSDVTLGYVNQIKTELEGKIDGKQASGNYALTSDIPTKVSQLQNDSEFVNTTTFNNAIDGVKLPAQTGNSGKYLTTDGTSPSWVDFTGADTNLSNLTSTGEKRLHALKCYEDAGELLTDSEGLADIRNYAYSSFDLSKFTQVGTPTITSDGILTGSSTNAVSFTGTGFANASTFDIYGDFTCNDTTVSRQYLFSLTSGFGLALIINGTSLQTHISSNGTSWNVVQNGNITTVTQGDHYYYHINYDGEKYNFYIKTNVNWVLQKSYTGGISPSLTSSADYAVGGLTGADRNIHGTIDLKRFSVFINGVKVFSGNKTGTDTYSINGSTVSIPYTISKTGSKIADSAYRSQVASVYNTFGYAPYYTLSDSDFTLPQGEIYGMLGQKLDADLGNLPQSSRNSLSVFGLPDYNNGISVDITNIGTTNTDFTVPANGYLSISLTVTNGAEVFYIDDKPIFWWYSSSGSTTGWSTPIPIYSGTHTFKTSSQASRVTSVVFYPMKGAN